MNFATLEQSFKDLPSLSIYPLITEKIVYLDGYREEQEKLTFNQLNRRDISLVVMPFLTSQSQNSGQTSILQQNIDHRYWASVESALNRDMRNSEDVVDAIKSYNKKIRKYSFDVLHEFSKQIHPNEKFIQLFKGVTQLALKLPQYLPDFVPLLKRNFGRNQVLFLTQMQIAVILANAFFCNFPWRTHTNNKFPTFPIFQSKFFLNHNDY